MLGLEAFGVTANDAGLVALPKPLVAHVERDHFVAVTRADKKGVTYVCSDCGPWPGGEVHLNWSQWRQMSMDGVLAIAKPGTARALALRSLPTLPGQRVSIKLASNQTGNMGIVRSAQRLLRSLSLNVIRQGNVLHDACGGVAFHQPFGEPKKDCANAGPNGPSAGDPVVLANGEEQYTPDPDLEVYNPTGPSVTWGRTYMSMTNPQANVFGCNTGWSHSYNYCILDGLPNNGARLQLPDGSTIAMQINGYPNTTDLVVPTSLPSGTPLQVNFVADPNVGTNHFELVFEDRTRIEFQQRANSYNGVEYPVTEYDPSGNFISFQYSAARYGENNSFLALTSILDSSGYALLTLSYGSNGLISQASDRYGRSVYYQVANLSGSVSDYFYGITQVSEIVPTGTSYPPVRYGYTYVDCQAQNNSSEQAPYLSSITVPSPTGTGTNTATINYTSLGIVSSTVDGNGNETLYTTVPNGSGGAMANATRVQKLNSSGTVTSQYDSYFDSYTNETMRVNALGQTEFTALFNSQNTPLRPASVTDGNGRTWSYTYDWFNHVLTQTTPKGTITTNAYTYTNPYTSNPYTSFNLGELQSTGTGSKTPTSFSYYEPSGLIQNISTPIPGQVGALNTQGTSFVYDSVGNLTSVTSPGNNATSTHTTTFGYTADGSYMQNEMLGRPITISSTLGYTKHLRYDNQGNTLNVTDAIGNKTSTTYNIANQPVSVSLPATGQTGAGNATTTNDYLYAGGPLNETNAYDESGNLVRTSNITYGLEGETLATSGNMETSTTTYDPSYNVKTLADGNGNVTTYTYDLVGRLTKVAYPGATGANYDQIEYTSFDAVGNLLSRTDGNGQVTNYAYGDNDGLLSSVSYSGLSGFNETFTYDVYDRLSASTDGTGSSSTAYDDLDNATSATRTYTGIAAQTLSYTYYPDGSRETLSHPSAGTWTYSYDADGRYTSLSSPAGTSSATYLNNGWEASRTLPGGAYTDYSYNAVGVLTGQTNYTSTNAILAQYTGFAYDGVFNPLAQSSTVPGSTSRGGNLNWTYDSKDRVTQEVSTRQGGYTYNFAYDAAGNPTENLSTNWHVNSDNQRTGIGNVYDGNGNPTTYVVTGLPTYTITYDPENRPLTIGSVWSATYRADGLRATKTGSGTTTYYLYDQGEPIIELNSSGTVTATNVYAPDGLVARNQPGVGWVMYAFDPQGNAAQRFSASGTVYAWTDYWLYGTASSTGPGISDTFGFEARYGYILDRELGWLHYCRNRYYENQSGRWLTRDPAGAAGGIDLYQYCGSAPLTKVDPQGLDTDSVSASIIQAAARNADPVQAFNMLMDWAGPDLLPVLQKVLIANIRQVVTRTALSAAANWMPKLKHCRKFFGLGMRIPNESQQKYWEDVMTRIAKTSNHVCRSRCGDSNTIAFLGSDRGRQFAVHFFADGKDTGQFASAFEIDRKQAYAMYSAASEFFEGK